MAIDDGTPSPAVSVPSDTVVNTANSSSADDNVKKGKTQELKRVSRSPFLWQLSFLIDPVFIVNLACSRTPSRGEAPQVS